VKAKNGWTWQVDGAAAQANMAGGGDVMFAGGTALGNGDDGGSVGHVR
jgi:hypothetical protein